MTEFIDLDKDVTELSSTLLESSRQVEGDSMNDLIVTTTTTTATDDAQDPNADSDPSSAIDPKTQENYAIWKSNSIQLYDYLLTTNTVWPSMTLQFFPDMELSADGDKTRYRVLTGTFTSGFKTEVLKLGSFQVQDSQRKINDRVKFDHSIAEFQNIQSISGKFETLQEINHSNLEILKARYLPHNPNLIASITNTGQIYIFDKSKYPSAASSEFKYEMVLNGHTKEGYGLCWNTQKEGHLLSCASDGSIIHWDITKHTTGAPVEQVRRRQSDNEGVNDVLWNPSHDSIFAAVGEDNLLKVYDTRQTSSEPIIQSQGSFHSGGINALSINLQNGFCIATGDSQETVNIWDIRSISAPSIVIPHAQSGSITSLKFNPKIPSLLLCASSNDPVVNLYDLSQSADEEKCVFKHGGHLLGVNDIDWNPSDEWMCGSVSWDNTVHFWKPSQTLLAQR